MVASITFVTTGAFIWGVVSRFKAERLKQLLLYDISVLWIGGNTDVVIKTPRG